MSSEKMVILKMLEEGKISTEDAAKLLASVDKTGETRDEARDEARKLNGSQTPPGRTASKDIAAGLGKTLAGLGRTAKVLEPRIRKLAGVAVEKTVEIADTASKSIQESMKNSSESRSVRVDAVRVNPARADAPSASSAPSVSPSERSAASVRSKTFEQRVDNNLPNELILKIPCGSIALKGYNGDAATVTLAEDNARANLMKLGNVYTFDCGESGGRIDADVFLPRNGFKRITVSSGGGMVTIDNMETGELFVNTSTCHVLVKNLTARIVKIDNMNGAVSLSSLKGEELCAENANGAVDVSNVDFRLMKLETTSEPVTVVSQGFYEHSEYVWSVRTSNARLKAVLPVSSGLGYDLKARTSLADVSGGLSGIVYTRNDRNCLEGKSENFSGCLKKVRLELETSNAPVAIN